METKVKFEIRLKDEQFDFEEVINDFVYWNNFKNHMHIGDIGNLRIPNIGERYCFGTVISHLINCYGDDNKDLLSDIFPKGDTETYENYRNRIIRTCKSGIDPIELKDYIDNLNEDDPDTYKWLLDTVTYEIGCKNFRVVDVSNLMREKYPSETKKGSPDIILVITIYLDEI
jgi:hypothetical protein